MHQPYHPCQQAATSFQANTRYLTFRPSRGHKLSGQHAVLNFRANKRPQTFRPSRGHKLSGQHAATNFRANMRPLISRPQTFRSTLAAIRVEGDTQIACTAMAIVFAYCNMILTIMRTMLQHVWVSYSHPNKHHGLKLGHCIYIFLNLTKHQMQLRGLPSSCTQTTWPYQCGDTCTSYTYSLLKLTPIPYAPPHASMPHLR